MICMELYCKKTSKEIKNWYKKNIDDCYNLILKYTKWDPEKCILNFPSPSRISLDRIMQHATIFIPSLLSLSKSKPRHQIASSTLPLVFSKRLYFSDGVMPCCHK